MVKFSKYSGLGNDFIILDANQGNIPDSILSGHAIPIKQICHRRFGIGADGVILSLPSRNNADARMRIFNSDGSEAEMCGNGIRCLVRFLHDTNKVSLNQSLVIETLAGPIGAQINNNSSISVDMGKPTFIPSEIPTLLEQNLLGIPEGKISILGEEIVIRAVGMGNPHMIVYVKDIRKVPLNTWGSQLESHVTFPAKTNVHFVQTISRSKLAMLVWERGSGETLACGTGACACAVMTRTLGLCESNIQIKLPGGNLNINWPDNKSNVTMLGPAQLICSGQFEISNFSE